MHTFFEVLAVGRNKTTQACPELVEWAQRVVAFPAHSRDGRRKRPFSLTLEQAYSGLQLNSPSSNPLPPERACTPKDML